MSGKIFLFIISLVLVVGVILGGDGSCATQSQLICKNMSLKSFQKIAKMLEIVFLYIFYLKIY